MYAEEKKIQARINTGFKLDFHVRWNTTYEMLNRFISLKSIVNEITMNAELIPNISVKLFIN